MEKSRSNHLFPATMLLLLLGLAYICLTLEAHIRVGGEDINTPLPPPPPTN
jgi:hypothetical protein